MTEQNYANHVKWVPAFHFFAMPVLVLNFGQSIYRMIHWGFSIGRLTDLLTAAALVVTLFLSRVFALKVQDRVIRLEEQLRMERVLPGDLKARIGEFSVAQLVGLRFASNEELPALARKVLDDKIEGTKAIKLMVKSWRGDFLRA